MLLAKLNRVFKAVLLLTIFITPIFTASFGFGYEHIKVIFFIFIISMASLLWLVISWIKPAKLTLTPVQIASLLFIACLLFTGLFGINPQQSVFGSPPYFQGLILYSYLFLFSFLISISKISLKTWSLLLTVSSIFISLLAIKDFLAINLLNQSIPTYAGRVVATFGQPNFYAGFLLINLPFVYLAIKKMRFYWKIILMGIPMAGILVSFSRSSIIILLLYIFAFFWFKLKKDFPKTTAIFMLGLTVSLLIIFSDNILNFYKKEIVEPLTSPRLIGGSPEKRIFIWPIMANLAQSKPILGFGLDNISQSYNQYFRSVDFNRSQNPAFYSLKDVVVSSSHNYLIDILLFSGIPGLISWAILVFFLLKRVKSKTLLSSLIIYLIWVQFQNQSIANLMQFWLLTGLISVDRG